MSKRKYRQTSSEIKAKAVLEALQEKEEIAVIAARYDVDPRNLKDWKKQFIENSSSVFENKAEEKLKEEQGVVDPFSIFPVNGTSLV
jgi:putative transposase